MIGVTGATGQLGRLVINGLKARVPASDIAALARTPAKAKNLGVTVREADYGKPETLDRALAGIDTLLLISSNEIGRRATQHRNVIEAAKKAGVKWVVYTSLLHADRSPLSLAYASFDVGASQGALFDHGRELSKLIGRPTTPLSVSVAGALNV